LKPEGTLRIITLGGSGGIHQDYNHQVLKAPLKHNTQGCNKEVIAFITRTEEYSEECIAREKLIYQSLPNDDPNILKCLGITERGIQLPYLQHRDVRNYLKTHSIDTETQHRWIQNAIDAVATIHAYGIVHCDISPRNFLVTDDLSIQLSDFAGSKFKDLQSLAEEETRYRLPLPPSSPRTIVTDLFALGSFIYEISTGTCPFPDLDDEEIEHRYASQKFPNLDGLEHREVISKCWKSHYSSAEMLKRDVRRLRKPSVIDTKGFSPSLICSTLAMIGIGFTFWVYTRRNR
jgi:serine/threonine protein kinase